MIANNCHRQPLYGVPGKSHRDPRRHKNDQGLPLRCHLVRPHVQKYPRLTIGATQLFCHQSHGDQPTTIHAAPLGTARVINTLLRVVHGGSSGWGSLPMGQPPTGDPEINDDPYPTENKDPKRRRIVFAGGGIAHPSKSVKRCFSQSYTFKKSTKDPQE